ncbi:MAG: spondin domain-containing protein [Acidobacteria bacterium]|nr:spondin domain-containing protein [Acidobacteriota bacterium]
MSCHSASGGLRRLVWTVLAAAGAGLWLAAPAAAQNGGVPEATYEVTFQGTWTTASTPGGVVGGAHFTTLIGAVHNNGVTFWRSGERATPGVELVAETGGTSRFMSEIEAGSLAVAVIRQGIGQGGTSRATFTVEVTDDHPLVTLLSMIGPSPDWFVGVSGLSLQDDSGHWVERQVLDLYPYDAGTEEGDEFSLNNPPTQPQGAITSIRGMGKFSNQPMARLTFVRQGAPDPGPEPVPALPLAWPTLLTLLAVVGGSGLYLRRRGGNGAG